MTNNDIFGRIETIVELLYGPVFVVAMLVFAIVGALFSKKLNVYILGGIGLFAAVAFIGWSLLYVYSYPKGVDKPTWSIAGLFFSEGSTQLIAVEPELRSRFGPDFDTELVYRMSNNPSLVWTDISVTLSKVVGLVALGLLTFFLGAGVTKLGGGILSAKDP